MDWAVLSPLLITGAALGLVGLERLFPYDRGQRLFRHGFWTDLLFYTIVQSYVLAYVIGMLIRWMDAVSHPYRTAWLSDWPLAAQVAFFVITHDLYIYWFHRWQHQSPLLWRLHEAHHSVADVDWIAGSRSHALEILINQTVEFAPIVLLGAPPEVALIKATISAVWGMWIHSNIDVRTGALQRIVNGPEAHRWHHAVDHDAYDKNFGTKLAIWDRLFGTAFLPRGRKPAGYGLPHLDFPPGYFRQLVFAFRNTAR